MKSNTRSAGFRPDIEGLRGIAVLIVVLFHSGIPGFSGGFAGVDVFFVLSGYLITGLLVAEVQKTSRLSLPQFYARRVRRLLPASALTLLITLVIGAVILAPQELMFAGRAARAMALYVSNIFFSINAADYFAPDVKFNPLLHTWSLAVEEQFYLFWPLLIILGLVLWRSKKALLVVLSSLTLLSLGVSIWFTARGGTFAFYDLPARAWEFGLGGLAVLLPIGLLKLPSRWWLALGWLGVLVILASAHFIAGDNSFPGWIALFPVFGTVLALIAGSEQPHRGVGILLDSAPLQFLGILSYSWYLWHWPFLVFSRALLPNISVVGKTAVALAALAVAWITHTLVENPIRFHPYLVKRVALSLYLGGALTLCSLTAAFLSMRYAVKLAKAPEMRTITAAVDDIAKMPRQECVSLGDSPEVKTCTFGDKSSATNIVLFGDSHAIQWFDPLLTMAKSNGWKLTTMVKSGCPATDVTIAESGATFAASCNSWRANSIRTIIALRPSLVFIANASTYLDRGDNAASQLSIPLEQWRDGTRRTLQALSAADLPVVVMRDNPLSTFDVPTCLARSVRHSWYPGGACEMDRARVLNPAVFEAEKEGAQGLPNIHFIDLTDRLCQQNVCPTVQSGEVMYRDDNHLTGTFAESLMPVLGAELLPILNKQRM